MSDSDQAPADVRVGLAFPDVPRLELDQLLGQLVERAQEVMGTQGRLRGLLRANQMVVGDLDLPAVLKRIAEAARDLVGARYAALGVISADGHLSEFVHTGMDDETVQRIGDLPQGKGLLGALIDDPEAIRLTDIGDDPRSSGFPSGHPPMRSFLGVPIRVRDEVFGNLYLAEATGGEFSLEDEQLAQALAATAAGAIDNARLYQAAMVRQEWLRAAGEITQGLLAPDGGGSLGSLRLIADSARRVARADLVYVMLPTPDGAGLRVEVVVGTHAQVLEGERVDIEGSMSGQVFSSGAPMLVSDLQDQGMAWVGSDHLQLGPMLLVPLAGPRGVRGVLVTGRRVGDAAFGRDDLDMAASFANQAAVALELAEARAEQQRVSMYEERDRIAADLHDQVIQRIFGSGLALQSVLGRLEPGTVRDRIQDTIDNLDATTRQIRTTIFSLRDADASSGRGVRARLLEIAAELGPALGRAPSVRFAGLLEDNLPDALVEDLVAVFREALSNVARHARARTVEVDLTAESERVVLVVADDGVGIPAATTRRSGLANLELRARRHGGDCTVSARQPTGTRLVWRAGIG